MDGEDEAELATASESDEGVVAGPAHPPLLVPLPGEALPHAVTPEGGGGEAQAGPDGKRQYRCRNCGEKGHNRVRCPAAAAAGPAAGAAADGEGKAKRRYRCGACGEDGHTKKKCPRLHEFGDLSDEAGPAPAKRGTFHCSICGKKGHTKRSCPERRSQWAEPQGRPEEAAAPAPAAQDEGEAREKSM